MRSIQFLTCCDYLKRLCERSTRAINEQLDTNVTITEEGEFLYYNAPNCAYCKGWHSESPVCYAVAGAIHGFLAWALESDGFQIHEITCRAKGDEVCRFRIRLNSTG
jgi:predicted hydrocarbon binding protein